MLYALAVPLALMIVLDKLLSLSNLEQLKWPIEIISMAIYVLFAITCHRLVLIGDQSVPKYGLLKWTQRETQFFGWCLVLMLAFIVPWLIFFMFFFNSFLLAPAMGLVESDSGRIMIVSLSFLPSLYIVSRLGVLYPATAVERPADMKWAWNLSKNNGWRLTFVIGLLPWVSYFLVGFLLRENATWVEEFIVLLISFIFLAVEIVALSFSYKHLTKPIAPPASGT